MRTPSSFSISRECTNSQKRPWLLRACSRVLNWASTVHSPTETSGQKQSRVRQSTCCGITKGPETRRDLRESSPGCHSRRSARWNSGSPWLNTETNTEYSIECHALSTGTKNRGVLTKIMPVILILLILLILLFWLLFWLFSVTWYRINCKYTTVC